MQCCTGKQVDSHKTERTYYSQNITLFTKINHFDVNSVFNAVKWGKNKTKASFWVHVILNIKELFSMKENVDVW